MSVPGSGLYSVSPAATRRLLDQCTGRGLAEPSDRPGAGGAAANGSRRFAAQCAPLPRQILAAPARGPRRDTEAGLGREQLEWRAGRRRRAAGPHHWHWQLPPRHSPPARLGLRVSGSRDSNRLRPALRIRNGPPARRQPSTATETAAVPNSEKAGTVPAAEGPTVWPRLRVGHAPSLINQSSL
jgi:hypothetical protein